MDAYHCFRAIDGGGSYDIKDSADAAVVRSVGRATAMYSSV